MADNGLNASQLADQHHERGVESLNAGLIEVAKDHFKEALHLEPEREDSLLKFGYSLLHLGEIHEAGQIFRKFLSVFPSQEGQIANCVYSLFISGRYDDHVRACLEMIPSCSNTEPLLIQLAWALSLTGNFDQIIADREQYPEQSLVPVARAFIAEGRHSRAIDEYSKSLKEFPDSWSLALEFIRALSKDMPEGNLLSARDRCMQRLLGTKFTLYPVWLNYQLTRHFSCKEDMVEFDGAIEIPFPPEPGTFTPSVTGLSTRVYDLEKIQDLKSRYETPHISHAELKENILRFQKVVQQIIDEGHFQWHQDNMKVFRRYFGVQSRDPVFVLSTGRCGTLALHNFIERSRKVCSYHTLYWQLYPLDRNHLLYRIIKGDFDKNVLTRILGAYVENRTMEILYAIRNDQIPVIINHWDTVFAPFNAILFPESRFIYMHRDDEKVFRSIYGKNQWQSNQLQFSWFDPDFHDGRFTHFFDQSLEIEEEIAWYLYVTREFSRAFLETMPKDRVLAFESEDMFGGGEETFNEIRRIIPADDLGLIAMAGSCRKPANGNSIALDSRPQR